MALRVILPAPMRVAAGSSQYCPSVYAIVHDLSRARKDAHRIKEIMQSVPEPPPLSISIDTPGSTPTRRRLAESSTGELTLIEWQPGHIIPRHSHPDLMCWMRVLSGALTETTYLNHSAQPSHVNRLTQASPCQHIADVDYQHRLENNQLRPAISIHYYETA
jgi:hypothetical protein